ncbi:hypothetical protein IMCC21906_02332 [Spongiibacter sp. IMCC21906]|uniref:hypothetical protein n=1 Tax=Spongiibacter sp. IMCC21906 TaxID=1620392 RepID=UPI00062DFD02|nr:hypothetical protein [Spongiibacter sp. IMCC21906]AKH69992.1 hypothetical protein IMCC21906_02332 [Spongiibacter sp. IMCC21906]
MASKRLIYACNDLETVTAVAELLNQRHLVGWKWSVVTESSAAISQKGLPVASFFETKSVLRLSILWGFWGLVLGLLAAILLVSLWSLPEGALRTTTLWSLPLCVLGFSAWLGGLLGLSQDLPALKPFLKEVALGHFVILLTVNDVDERLLKKIMAMAGARKLGEYRLGLRWDVIFPRVGGEHG